LGFALIAILILGVVAYISMQRIYQKENISIRENLELVRDEVRASYLYWLDKRTYQIQTVVTYPDVSPLVDAVLRERIPDNKSISPALAQLRRKLNPILKENRDLGFFVISREGISLGSMRDTNLWTKNLIARQRPNMFHDVLQGKTLLIPTIISDVPLGDTADDILPPTLFLATPIRDAQGSISGVFTLRVDYFQEFSLIANRGRIGRTGEIYAFDQKGILVSESRFKNALAKAGIISAKENTAARIRLSDPGKPINTQVFKGTEVSRWNTLPFTYMTQLALNGEIGWSLRGYRDYRGVESVGAWLWDSRLSMGIVAKQDKIEAFELYNFVRNVWLVSLIAVTIAILLLVLSMAALRFRTERVLLERGQRLEKMNRKLVAAKNEAQMASRMKTHFLNNMNHELRTPLNAITGNAYHLKSMPLDTRAKKYVDVIDGAARSLFRLLENILQIANLKFDTTHSVREPFNLHQMLFEIKKIFETEITRKGIEFDFQMSEEVPCYVRGDATSIKSVLQHLIDNALKFTSQGRIAFHVNVVGTESDLTKVSFCVIDSGIGIHSDQLDNAFQLFSQVEDSTVRKIGGTGVGLPLCKQLIDKMNGSINVNSVPGDGSHFTVVLPIEVNLTRAEMDLIENGLKNDSVNHNGQDSKSSDTDTVTANNAGDASFGDPLDTVDDATATGLSKPPRANETIQGRHISKYDIDALKNALSNDDLEAKSLLESIMQSLAEGTMAWTLAMRVYTAVEAYQFETALKHFKVFTQHVQHKE
jgi:signal transduction histidine kinase